MSVVEPLCDEQEPSELAPVQSALLCGVDGGTAYVLGGVGRDPPVDVSEAVETARGGQPPVDCGGGQTAFLHRRSVHLEVGAGRLEHGHAVIGCPLEQVTKIVAVGVEGPAAVAGQESTAANWASSGTSGPTAVSSSAEKSRVVICDPPLLVVGPGNTRKGKRAW